MFGREVGMERRGATTDLDNCAAVGASCLLSTQLGEVLPDRGAVLSCLLAEWFPIHGEDAVVTLAQTTQQSRY
jgi:hypothetical protein